MKDTFYLRDEKIEGKVCMCVCVCGCICARRGESFTHEERRGNVAFPLILSQTVLGHTPKGAKGFRKATSLTHSL